MPRLFLASVANGHRRHEQRARRSAGNHPTIKTIKLEWNCIGLTFPVPGIIDRQWRPGSFPEKYSEFRQGYAQALEAARRAREKTTPAGRAYVDYWIGRLEFGVGYFDTVEAVRLAATAEKSGDRAEALRNAEDALGKAQRALEAFVRVARDRSDYGTIATLDEYVWRPLKARVAGLKKHGTSNT